MGGLGTLKLASGNCSEGSHVGDCTLKFVESVLTRDVSVSIVKYTMTK